MYCWTVCDPTVANIIDKGTIEQKQIRDTFENFPWREMLDKLNSADQSKVYYSPSIEFRSEKDNRGITFSAVDAPDGYIFYIFYQRPEKVKKWFGFLEIDEPKFVSDILDQSKETALEILNEFVAG
ncbi:MAG: hypothetical protein MJK04_29975, partial [Psychrosphaera sp.]|nr:hypothetical protein [Psychrosphaera sp.]